MPLVAEAEHLNGLVQNWHTCKIAMISSILYVPAAFTMAITGWSSKRFQERNFHIAGCFTISGVAFMCVSIFLPDLLYPGRPCYQLASWMTWLCLLKVELLYQAFQR